MIAARAFKPCYHRLHTSSAIIKPSINHKFCVITNKTHRTSSYRCTTITTASLPTNNSNSTPHFHDLESKGWLIDTIDPLQHKYHAIMMLGGGLKEDGGLPPWVVRRLDGALHLYNQQQHKCPIVLLGAGTPHKPAVITSSGHVLHESSAYAKYLMEQGVPARDLLKESQSYDTVGNGYFSLVIHALPAGWRRVAIVTSDFHMPRTRAIFDTTYALAPPLRTQNGTRDPRFTLSYHPVSDEGLFESEIVSARIMKEAAAVERWHQDTGHFTKLSELHSWLFDTHLCYSASRQHEFGVKDDLDPKLAATY